MNTGFKLKSIEELKGNIVLPTKNFAVINATSIRFCYQVPIMGRMRHQYINLTNPEDVAEFLKQRGKIYWYSITSAGVKMYLKTLVIRKGDTQQVVTRKEIKWSELRFTPDEVLHYAAINEYIRAGITIGLFPAKVIRLFNNIIHAAYG